MAFMKVVGDAFTAFGTFLFGGYAFEMALGGLPKNYRDYRNYKRKDSSSDIRKRSYEFEAENWEKNLSEVGISNNSDPGEQFFKGIQQES